MFVSQNALAKLSLKFFTVSLLQTVKLFVNHPEQQTDTLTTPRRLVFVSVSSRTHEMGVGSSFRA